MWTYTVQRLQRSAEVGLPVVSHQHYENNETIFLVVHVHGRPYQPYRQTIFFLFFQNFKLFFFFFRLL